MNNKKLDKGYLVLVENENKKWAMLDLFENEKKAKDNLARYLDSHNHEFGYIMRIDKLYKIYK